MCTKTVNACMGPDLLFCIKYTDFGINVKSIPYAWWYLYIQEAHKTYTFYFHWLYKWISVKNKCINSMPLSKFDSLNMAIFFHQLSLNELAYECETWNIYDIPFSTSLQYHVCDKQCI